MQLQNDSKLTKLKLLINEREKDFSQNEKIIASYFIEHENDILSFTTPMLSKECNVSQATVVRFCQSLGFSGLKEFKISYNSGKIDVKKYSDPVSWEDSDESVYYKVFTSAITAMQETFKMTNYKKLALVADKIASAENIDVFAIGGSAIVASYFANEFIRLGKRVNSHTDIYTIRHFAQGFSKGDLAFFVSRSGENLTELAKRAKASGCAVAVITCTPSSPLAEIADFTITASEALYMKGDRNSYSRIAEISIISVLFLLSALRLVKANPDFITNYIDKTSYEKI